MPQQQAPLDTHDQSCDRPRACSRRAPDGRGCLGDLPYGCSSGGDFPSCCRSGEYLKTCLPLFCSISPHSHFVFSDTQLAITIMSGLSVKIKTPQTGEYDQPTGL